MVVTKTRNHPKPPKTTQNDPKPPKTTQNHQQNDPKPPKTNKTNQNDPKPATIYPNTTSLRDKTWWNAAHQNTFSLSSLFYYSKYNRDHFECEISQ